MNPSRRHDIDALRALAFGLLILYHVGMYFVADWRWHLKSPHAADWLQWPMVAVNVWRMDLVFLISGVAFGFLARGRTTAALIGRRAWRLLLPLAFGMAVVVPYQAYAQGVANGLVAPGFGAFMLRYWVGGPWPKGAFDGSDFPMTWNHLWYLAYLFAYTVLLALLRPLQDSKAGRSLREGFAGLRGWRLLVLPALPLAACTVLLAPRFPATHAFVGDWYLHGLYFTAFMYGHWIGLDAGIWQELARLRRPALLLAVACLGAYLATRAGVLRALYLWTVIAAILGHAHRYLNRPWRWLAWANDSVYPWYILHQTLIIVAVVALAPLHLGPVLEAVLLVAMTVLGCWVLTSGLIRRVRWLRPLFGLTR
ncbi:MAG: acyltransferase [Comamonadaceae bacterium]|nr:MAG: acyltransferase [Comamonadaceae bacterium]